MAGSAVRQAVENARRPIQRGVYSAFRSGTPAFVQHQGNFDLSAQKPALAFPTELFAPPLHAASSFQSATFGKPKSQGEEVTGDHPAENPRNDVPPISPEEREKHPAAPPSPDAPSSEINDGDYTSPGQHPQNTNKGAFKPDLDNASPAVTQKTSSSVNVQAHLDDMKSCGNRSEKMATQAKKSAGVEAAPVETLLETPLSENNQPSSDRTGPASHDDDPPGVDKDPNVVPPKDDDDDKKKVNKADKEAWKAMSI